MSNKKNDFLLTILFSLLFIPNLLLSQNLLNQPESVVFDSIYNRYLVSNWATGNIVEIDSNNVQSYFLQNQHCHAGLIIKDSILYVACREYGVRAINLHDATVVFHIPISGAGNINDITSDTSGNLYVSNPTGSIIYKISISNQTYSVLIDSGLDTPNGLFFDKENNRIIIVSYRMFTTIQSFNLYDSSLTILAEPLLNNFDGITRDNNGNYYISSWYSNAIYKFDSLFTIPAEIFATFSDDPADISFNSFHNVIAVPLFFTNQVEFISTTTGIEEIDPENYLNNFFQSLKIINFGNQNSTISFSIVKPVEIEIQLFNILGEKVIYITKSKFPIGEYDIRFNSSKLLSGSYFLNLFSDQFNYSTKIILIK